MSLSDKGTIIECDGGCNTSAACPDVLPFLLGEATAKDAADLTGWLYVFTGSDWRHYCPECAQRYVKTRTIPGETT